MQNVGRYLMALHTGCSYNNDVKLFVINESRVSSLERRTYFRRNIRMIFNAGNPGYSVNQILVCSRPLTPTPHKLQERIRCTFFSLQHLTNSCVSRQRSIGVSHFASGAASTCLWYAASKRAHSTHRRPKTSDHVLVLEVRRSI